MPPKYMDYIQISDDLIQRMRSGEYPPGSMLPSYTKLAEMYSVSVSTSSRAYNRLRMMGWAITATGRGVHVPDPLPNS